MRIDRFIPLLFVAVSVGGWVHFVADEPKSAEVSHQDADFFERYIRPVFAERCVSCHGPEKQKGGLRLDSKAAALKGSHTGPVIVPGSPEKSILINALRYDGDLKMPPTEKMPDDVIAAFTAWVKNGALWPGDADIRTKASAVSIAARKDHWAFRPVAKPIVPQVPLEQTPNNPVDAFVFAKLADHKMTPSPQADRRTLIRRATFDLIGLPPTPEEVEEFVNDASPEAFAKLIDRLLASPAYGERWGRHWLDVARYADTKGYVFLQERRFPASYTFRDYVIRAFNEDLPYDTFLRHQLAADQLKLDGDRRPLAAMGFLTVGRRFLNNPPDIIDDQIDAVTRGMMGLTVSCARCHDHKYDPIPTADYYSLYGIFANSVEPAELPLIDADNETPERIAFTNELEARQRKVQEYLQAIRAERSAEFRTRVADLLLAVQNGQLPPGEPAYPLFFARELPPRVVTIWKHFLQTKKLAHHPVLAPWFEFAALSQKDFAAKSPAIAARIAANADSDRPINPLVAQMFADRPPPSLRAVAMHYGNLFDRIDRLWQAMIQPSAEKQQPTRLPNAAKEEIRQLLYSDTALFHLTAEEIDRQFDEAVRNEITKRRRQVDEWRATGPGAPPRAMVLNDSPRIEPTHVMLRGNPKNRGPMVPRQFLEVLSADERKPFKNGSGRLELADAVANPNNPLTARVLVNRIWLHHFGHGLVRTPSDFGLRGDPPTHPELLDYLAAMFVENGWSIKDLHRLIMHSQTYQQRSDDDLRNRELDPENRLLWRMNRRRLEFEALRDSLLAVAGRLDPTSGGPSVDINQTPFPSRRAVYAFIDRQNLPGMFRTFDFASPDTSNPQRHQTIVPQQALYLMNSPFVVDQAGHLISRPDVAARQSHPERIRRLYQIVYGRDPDQDEIQLGRRFLDVSAGQKDTADPWVKYAQALLLANEFAYVD